MKIDSEQYSFDTLRFNCRRSDIYLVRAIRAQWKKTEREKMATYGNAAVKAVALYTAGKASSIIDGWEIATRDLFSTESTRTKACPRTTFLGICESGHVLGVPVGEYNTKISDNKRYGLRAIAALRSSPALAADQALLWKKIGNDKLKPNSQMDVVCALWDAGLII